MKKPPRLKDFSHKVRREDAAAQVSPSASFGGWFDGLPSILAAKDIKEIALRWVRARTDGKEVILGCGAHVVKVGLFPWLIAFMREGLITHLAVNGAFAIHDYELAAVGHTSEDVGPAISEGVFGTAEETAVFLNGAAGAVLEKDIGLGEAVSLAMAEAPLAHADASILAAAARLKVPVTIHAAIGTDTIHAHPSADGKAIGHGSLIDFNRFADSVSRLDGGLYLNVGSAVLLPEIFLKAVSRARSRGISLSAMTTVVMDFMRQYRPQENVCRRPLGAEGTGYYLVGHHEIMVPLLLQAVYDRWAARA